jgi:hypothetical protein
MALEAIAQDASFTNASMMKVILAAALAMRYIGRQSQGNQANQYTQDNMKEIERLCTEVAHALRKE